MASCSSSDLRPKLMEETAKTARSVPSRKITVSSRISVMGNIPCVVALAGFFFGAASAIELIIPGFSNYLSSSPAYTPPVSTISEISLSRLLEIIGLCTCTSGGGGGVSDIYPRKSMSRSALFQTRRRGDRHVSSTFKRKK